MRLLDKNTVVRQQAQEHKLEIDEGLKLAQKIDLLRKTASEEEKKLADFRIGSLTAIQNELKPLNDKKASLENDVKDLEKKREKLKEPLDNEWARLEDEKKNLEKDKEELTRKVSNFLQEAVKQDKRDKAIKVEEERLEEIRIQANKMAVSALSDRDIAKELLNKAKAEAEEVFKECESKKAELISREMIIAGQERGIINTKALLSRREKELDLQERAIKDKYDTLLRTINRK